MHFCMYRLWRNQHLTQLFTLWPNCYNNNGQNQINQRDALSARRIQDLDKMHKKANCEFFIEDIVRNTQIHLGEILQAVKVDIKNH